MDGVETGFIEKTKIKKEGDKTIKEIKTTTLNPDGTKKVVETIEDASGVQTKTKHIGKDNKLLSIEWVIN